MTPQVTSKVSVELAGKLLIGMPLPCKLAIVTLAAGTEAAQVVPTAEVQVTVLQLRPVATGSRSMLPLAAAGPVLLMVMV